MPDGRSRSEEIEEIMVIKDVCFVLLDTLDNPHSSISRISLICFYWDKGLGRD